MGEPAFLLDGEAPPAPRELAALEPFPPLGAELLFEGVILGEPATAGSKSAFPAMKNDPANPGKKIPVRDANGRIRMIVSESNEEKSKGWRSAILEVVTALYTGDVLDCPLVLAIVEFRPRKPGHFSKRTGELLPSAPLYPAVRPDSTKVLRAFEDALAKVVFHEDSRNVDLRTGKRFDGGPARVEFRLWRLPAKAGDLDEWEVPGVSPVSEVPSLLD